MIEKQMASTAQLRPLIVDYKDLIEFLKSMLSYLRFSDSKFSVLSASRGLRKVSPALVTLVLQGKRPLTLDRVDEFSKLFRLNAVEKSYLKTWVLEKNNPEPKLNTHHPKNRKEVSTHILKDWINMY
nr:hypothetical protein [Pseudobdellovibrionaceae bacterium]